MRTLTLATALLTLTLAPSLPAADGPTTAPSAMADAGPSTQPSAKALAALPVGVDPLVTWAAYDKAMRAGDVDYLLANYKCQTPDEARYALAMAEVDAANGLLMQAVEEKFGAQSGHDVGHKLGDVCVDDAKAGTVTLKNATTAIITTEEPDSGFSFVLVDGTWKHDVSEMTREDGFNLKMALENSARAAESVKKIRQDLLAGKYTTVDAVMAAIEESKK